MSFAARRIVAIGGFAFVLVVLIGWLLLWQPFAGSSDGSTVRVVIPPGSSVTQVGDILEHAGVVDNAGLFALRARIDGDSSAVRAGALTMRKDMSYSEALDTLTSAPASAPVRTVTIPEGLSRGQVAALVKRSGLSGDYMALSRSSTLLSPKSYGGPASASLEGFLFPSTYELKLPATAKELVDSQVAAFKERFAKIDVSRAKAKNLTTFDLVTIASMIERETAAPVERALISSVIWNRLHQHIPLGIDAATRYEFNNWTQPLLQSQLTADSPWNTRLHAGLTPGPIGNPGEASLKAAAHPASTKYIFYVAKPWTCGRHSFSQNSTQFDADVAAYNAARESNGGRAPTRCP